MLDLLTLLVRLPTTGRLFRKQLTGRGLLAMQSSSDYLMHVELKGSFSALKRHTDCIVQESL